MIEEEIDMNAQVWQGILIPFAGTALGAACVFIMRGQLRERTQRILAGFAAGAMLYVVVEELIPEMTEGAHSNVGTVFFAAGFTVMMALDVALG